MVPRIHTKNLPSGSAGKFSALSEGKSWYCCERRGFKIESQNLQCIVTEIKMLRFIA